VMYHCIVYIMSHRSTMAVFFCDIQ